LIPNLGAAISRDVHSIMAMQKDRQVPILLEPRSLLVLRGEARYQWTYGIVKHQQDRVNGTIIERERRLSITFRNMIL
jgi:alkylated DNA repair dioxygenase AlkB